MSAVRTLVVNALRMSNQPTAMGRYIQYVAEQWSRTKVPFDRVVLMSPREFHVQNLGQATPIEMRTFGGALPLAVWEQVALPWRARGVAMLFCPSYTGPVVHPGPMVVANHGIYEVLSAEFSRLARMRSTPLQHICAKRAKRVIANSSVTKADLIRFFHIPEDKIETVYPAAHDLFFQRHDAGEIDAEVVRTLGRRVPYILFVGKLAKRRNVPNLIEAFAIVRKEKNLPHHLLIVGPNTSGVPVAELARTHGVANEITYCVHAEHEPLARLYAGADVFALPTTYEGISHTMFEAMASGTAVLTVEHPTLREGGGNAAFSVPTASVEDLVKGLACLLSDASVRRHYAEEGRDRARRFSWETIARETMKILDREANPADS